MKGFKDTTRVQYFKGGAVEKACGGVVKKAEGGRVTDPVKNKTGAMMPIDRIFLVTLKPFMSGNITSSRMMSGSPFSAACTASAPLATA